MVPPKHVLSCSQSEIISKIPSDFLLGQHRTIEREIAVSKKEPAEASPSSFGEAQSDCQRRAGSQNEIRQSEAHMQLCVKSGLVSPLCFSEVEHPLHDSENMLNLAAYDDFACAASRALS